MMIPVAALHCPAATSAQAPSVADFLPVFTDAVKAFLRPVVSLQLVASRAAQVTLALVVPAAFLALPAVQLTAYPSAWTHWAAPSVAHAKSVALLRTLAPVMTAADAIPVVSVH